MPCPFATVGKWFVALFVGVKVVQVFFYNRFRIKDEKKDNEKGDDRAEEDEKKNDVVSITPSNAEEGKKIIRKQGSTKK